MASDSTATPNAIGRYRIDRVLGAGAAGIVYRAYDPVLNRTVAIKSGRIEQLDQAQLQHLMAEFRHEASIAGRFAHENIVAIYDLIEDRGLTHIVMEYVTGRSVQEYLQSVGPMPVEAVLSIIYKCAEGLAYLHYNGVIHRDIKPGNILYHHAGDLVKIMDFSIAEAIDQPGPRESGTAAYMAPEHFDSNRKITPLTDVFALGATMYRMLVKRYPFSRQNIAAEIMSAQQVPVHEIRPEIPLPVSQIVDRAMAKTDAARFQSAAALAHEIERVLGACYPGSLIASQRDAYMTSL